MLWLNSRSLVTLSTDLKDVSRSNAPIIDKNQRIEDAKRLATLARHLRARTMPEHRALTDARACPYPLAARQASDGLRDDELRKEGEAGRKKINEYTRYLTVLLTTVQGYWIAVGLESLGATQGIQAVVEPGIRASITATSSTRFSAIASISASSSGRWSRRSASVIASQPSGAGRRWTISSKILRPRATVSSRSFDFTQRRILARALPPVATRFWALACFSGDIPKAMTCARRALDSTGPDDHFERGAATGFLALGHWRNGELELSYRYWSETMASLQRAGHAVDALGCIRPLAEIRIAQGRLRDAKHLYERGLHLAAEGGGLVLRGSADMHVGMSGLLIEWNDLDAAQGHLSKSEELGQDAGLPINPHRWHVAMASIRNAEGDLTGALAHLDEAERLYVGEQWITRPPIERV
mgnify:CR=1 FL=1